MPVAGGCRIDFHPGGQVSVASRIEIRLPSDMGFLGVPDVVLTEVCGELECSQKSLEELCTAVIEA